MDRILSLLDTYKGRDKVLRLLCYSSKCAAGLIKSPLYASQFENFSKQLSTARTCFRLLDDIPAISDVVMRSAKQGEESSTMKAISWVENVVDVIFSPIDHISWAIDHKIIMSNNTMWDTASTLCWVISLYINIVKIAVRLSNISKQKIEINSEIKDRELLKKLSAEVWSLQLSAMKCIMDLLFAVNYLPQGMLWSQFFNKWQVASCHSRYRQVPTSLLMPQIWLKSWITPWFPPELFFIFRHYVK